MDSLIAGGMREIVVDWEGQEVAVPEEAHTPPSEGLLESGEPGNDFNADREGVDPMMAMVPGADVGLDALEYVPLSLSQVWQLF